MFLSAPSTIQPEPTPAGLAETIPLAHEEKSDDANATLPVKYVSKFNPRIYKNKRRAVRDTGEKTYVSMGVQSDYLPILTCSGPVDPVDPVDDYAPIAKKSRGRVAREYVPGTGNFSRSIGRYRFEPNLTVPLFENLEMILESAAKKPLDDEGFRGGVWRVYRPLSCILNLQSYLIRLMGNL